MSVTRLPCDNNDAPHLACQLLGPPPPPPEMWGPALIEATANWAGTACDACRETHPAAFKAPFSPLLSNENPCVICYCRVYWSMNYSEKSLFRYLPSQGDAPTIVRRDGSLCTL